jgi:transmembrane sensor
MLAAAVVLLVVMKSTEDHGAVADGETDVTTPPSAPVVPPIRLADGSLVQAQDTSTNIVVRTIATSRVLFDLERGAATFDVTPNPERRFEIQVGNVYVSVLGTNFVITRDDANRRVRVDVSRGRVAVRYPDGETELGMGESEWFSQGGREADDSASGEAPESAEVAARDSTRGHHRVRRGEWRALAQDGEFERAFDTLRRSGEGNSLDDVGELLLAADAARYSGHPEEAVRWLRRAIDRDRRDPRAPLAAFTLGRVLVQQLGRPREAALAFAEAQRLAPSGTMTEDALAREVECWSRAGEPALAASRARTYLDHYPDGRRIGAVRRYGGIE